MTDKLFYRPSEAAQSLAMSRTRVYAFMKSGDLGSVKVGASRRIPADELTAFALRLRTEGAGYTPRRGRQVEGRVSA